VVPSLGTIEDQMRFFVPKELRRNRQARVLFGVLHQGRIDQGSYQEAFQEKILDLIRKSGLARSLELIEDFLHPFPEVMRGGVAGGDRGRAPVNRQGELGGNGNVVIPGEAGSEGPGGLGGGERRTETQPGANEGGIQGNEPRDVSRSTSIKAKSDPEGGRYENCFGCSPVCARFIVCAQICVGP